MKNIKIDWEKRGTLIPTIIQDFDSLEVLTLAYSNKESFKKLLETKETYLYSTSRKKIWKKGETSGNTQKVMEIITDCDNDAILIKVRKKGPACHLGNESCFEKSILSSYEKKLDKNIFQKLENIISKRLKEDNKNSYTVSLKGKNGNKVLEKIIEEAGEFIISLKDKNKKEIIGEFCDLLYHSLVALNIQNIKLLDIEKKLEERFEKNGILEKKLRNKKIVIIDYGTGNISSVENSLSRLGVKFNTTNNKEEIEKSDLIIFPGVGNAKYAMEQLKKMDLVDVIKNYKKPFLGICLGMQLLFEKTQEGNIETLGIIEGEVKKFESEKFVIPHMGWNNLENILEKKEQNSFIYKFENKYFYFIHSYFCPISKYTTSITNYIENFSSTVKKDNFFGCQFHPEKSGKEGEDFLREFLINNL